MGHAQAATAGGAEGGKHNAYEVPHTPALVYSLQGANRGTNMFDKTGNGISAHRTTKHEHEHHNELPHKRESWHTVQFSLREEWQSEATASSSTPSLQRSYNLKNLLFCSSSNVSRVRSQGGRAWPLSASASTPSQSPTSLLSARYASLCATLPGEVMGGTGACTPTHFPRRYSPAPYPNPTLKP